jgi:hypothetical protein
VAAPDPYGRIHAPAPVGCMEKIMMGLTDIKQVRSVCIS